MFLNLKYLAHGGKGTVKAAKKVLKESDEAAAKFSQNIVDIPGAPNKLFDLSKEIKDEVAGMGDRFSRAAAIEQDVGFAGFKQNFVETFTTEEGLTQLGGSALRGALGWGVYGGVNEWSHGGSALEGFKSGAFGGVFKGAAWKGVKMMPYGAKKYSQLATGGEAPSMFSALGRYNDIRKQATRFGMVQGSQLKISNQLLKVKQNEATAKFAEDVMSTK